MHCRGSDPDFPCIYSHIRQTFGECRQQADAGKCPGGRWCKHVAILEALVCYQMPRWPQLNHFPEAHSSVHLPRSLLDGILLVFSKKLSPFTASVFFLLALKGNLSTHTHVTTRCIVGSAALFVKLVKSSSKTHLFVFTLTIVNKKILNIQCMYEKVKHMRIVGKP